MRPLTGIPILVVALWGSAAKAEEPEDDPARWLKELDLEAGSAEADLRLRELDLRDGVKVRLPPYHLRAERIHLSLGKFGVRVKGHGVLTFCPCDAPPVSIGFSGGWAGPPDELIVEDPTLRVLGVPVLWLPYLWLRSPRKIGLTTPDVSFRGADGLFLGQGVHLPIGRGLEVGAGVYTAGGFASTADLATERTSTFVRFDFRRQRDVGEKDVPSGAGLAIDARGVVGDRFAGITWDVDAIRGARGLRTTLDLDALARPYDRATAMGHVGPVRVGFDAMDTRGAPLGALAFVRPWVGLAGAFAHGTLGGSNGSISFGPRWVRDRGAESIANAGWVTTLAGPLGVALWEATARVDGRVARGDGGGGDVPMGGDRLAAVVGEARLEASLPLARAISLDRAAGGPPVLHVIEPLLRVSGVSAHASGDRGALGGFVAAPAFAESTRSAALFALGTRTRLGSPYGAIAPGRDPWIGKLAGELSIGALLVDGRRDGTLAGEVSWTTRNARGGSTGIELKGAGARALDRRDALGWLGVGRLRWEHARDGFGAELRGAARGDLPVLAGWALFGADLAPRLTTATGLIATGTTAGIGAALPVIGGFRLGGDLDVYGPSSRDLLTAARLIDLRGTLRYQHPCGCFRFAVRGGKIVGREGIDVFASFELARTDPNQPRDY